MEIDINKIIRQGVKRILPGHLPDFIVIGAQKAATTSLHGYLSEHPCLIGSRPKEVHYFDVDKNYCKGLNWYKHNFPNTKGLLGKFKYFESTPSYLYLSYVAERIHRFNPRIRMVIVLREPVDRAYSAWAMYRQFGRRNRLPEALYNGYLAGVDNNTIKEFYCNPEFPTFEQVVKNDIMKTDKKGLPEEPSVVRRGIYYPQIKRYFDLFGRSNFLVLGFKDLIGDKRIETLNAILNLIDLPPSDWSFLKGEPKNVGKNKDTIPPDVAEQLHIFYKQHNDQLFDLLSYKPNW